MLWIVFTLLMVLWLVGFTLHFADGVMHVLVISAVIVLLYKLISDTLRPDLGK